MSSRAALAIAALGRVGLRRSPMWAIAVLLVSGGLALSTAAEAADANSPGQKACTLLISTQTPGIPKGSDEEILNSCTRGACLSHYTDSTGQTRCAYALGAFLALHCAGTSSEARAHVRRELDKGYRRVNVGADLAGIVASSKGAGVVLAVGRAWILFTEGASSDDNPNPVFAGARQHVIRGTRNLTRALRKLHGVC